MSGKNQDLHLTPHGFQFGKALVQACCSDEKAGGTITIDTPRERLEIRVTPSGQFRIAPVVLKKKAKRGDNS